MIIIKEVVNPSTNEISFVKVLMTDDGKELPVETITYHEVSVRRDHKTYYLIYDRNWNYDYQSFEFINFHYANDSDNTRHKAAVALKILYCFQDIISKKIEEFTENDVRALVHFLRGESYEGSYQSFRLSTIRNNETLSGYLSIYRTLLRTLPDTQKHILLAKKNFNAFLAGTPKNETYRVTAGRTVKNEIPKYIRLFEFQKLLDVVDRKFTKRDEIIIRLMYETGLRIGEVLGLTIDDLFVEKHEYYDEGTGELSSVYAPTLYIRNRLSDAKYQCAKSCMNITSAADYGSASYRTEGDGFQKVVISNELYELICNYLDEVHPVMEKKYAKRYQSVVADRVAPFDNPAKRNIYIFLSSFGSRLTDSAWNYTLRQIYSDAGIKVDKYKRSNNLNHRLRHGCAMFHRIQLGEGDFDLKEILRHRSISSVEIYNQPSIEDKIRAQKKFTDELYKQIPELKR